MVEISSLNRVIQVGGERCGLHMHAVFVSLFVVRVKAYGALIFGISMEIGCYSFEGLFLF